jgi:hypothetical protein
MGKRRDERFCSVKCRAAYDAGGAPAWGRGETQTRIVYRRGDDIPMRATAAGFLIACANCNKEFDSKGLRCCSAECERGLKQRRENLAVMAEVGMEPAAKKRCLQCGGVIPKWRNGRRVSESVQFCGRKCRDRHNRLNPADASSNTQKVPGNIDVSEAPSATDPPRSDVKARAIMNRRLRDLQRLLADEAAPYAARVRIEKTNGSHVKSTFSIGVRKAFIVSAYTPSDWRFARKVRADARRVLRNLRA